jgi:hypothetical protein
MAPEPSPDLDFLDEVRAASRSKAKGCSMRVILASILADDPVLYAKVQASLTLPAEQVTAVAIANVLTRRGYTVTQFVVGRHRKGECSCSELPDLEA